MSAAIRAETFSVYRPEIVTLVLNRHGPPAMHGGPAELVHLDMSAAFKRKLSSAPLLVVSLVGNLLAAELLGAIGVQTVGNAILVMVIHFNLVCCRSSQWYKTCSVSRTCTSW
jgi:hypothetical protein